MTLLKRPEQVIVCSSFFLCPDVTTLVFGIADSYAPYSLMSFLKEPMTIVKRRKCCLRTYSISFANTLGERTLHS